MSLRSPWIAARRTPRAARSRRAQRQRTNLLCESLESRRLLSIGMAAPSPSQIPAQPSLEVLPMASTGSTALTPQQIRTAYGINQITFSGGKVAGNGAGQTIAIIDAYNDPNIGSDLAAFDKQYGLPAPPSLTVENLGGSTTDPGWALETALDVEWAHAIAPAAKLVLVEASSGSLGGLLNAVNYARTLPGVSVVSMSWGSYEFWGEWNYDGIFTTPTGHENVSFVAASGDSGAWSGPMYPSVSPNVLAVGGTTLTLGSGNSYGSETGWSDSTGGFSGFDNGYWYGESEPSYQAATLTNAGLSYGLRTTPDVSFNADPNSGVAVYDSVAYGGQSGWFQVGGTSAAAPAWAGLVAIADQGLATGGKGPLSSTQLLTDLYSLPGTDFHDITSGNNGYSATTGYDLVTGRGTPRANLVVAGLLAANGVSATAGATTSPAASAVTVISSPSASSHLILVIFSSNGSGSGSGSSTSSGSTPSGGATAAPAMAMASTALAPAVGALPVPASGAQTGGANSNSTSTQVPQSAPGPSTAVQSPTASLALGQGLSQPFTTTRWGSLVTESQPPAPIDLIEAGPTAEANPPDLPMPEPRPAPEPVPAQPPVAPPRQPGGPSRDDQDKESVLTAEVSPAGRLETMAGESDETPGTAAPHGIATAVGAAAVAAGGYRLVLGQPGRRRGRGPTFRFPKP